MRLFISGLLAGMVRGVLATVRKKATKKRPRQLRSIVAGGIAIVLLSGRLGLKKLAFLQERDDRFSAPSAK